MSGLEVISAISAVISILDASIKVYEIAQKDVKLSETFHVTGRRLLIIRDTLETCKSHLLQVQNSLPVDVCNALEKTMEECDEKAAKLRQIFEKVLPGGNDGWEQRYFKVVKRLGKGNKVEELMTSITDDVQLLVNHHAVKSAKPEQVAELETIVKEIKLMQSSIPEEKKARMTFSSQDGAQTNNVNSSGGGQQINNNATVRTQYFGPGGMGKTQLAIAFAKRHHQEYDSVFWLNAASETTLKDSFRLVAEAIFDAQDAQMQQDELSLIQTRRWLSNKKNIRWLLIFDNFDDPGQYPIERYYPYVSHGAIIITTRRPDLVAGSEIRLQPLQDVEESRYLEEYERHWNIDPRRPLPLQEYQERTLYTTWDLSYTRLQGEDADAAKLLGLLAYFSNRRLWYKLFRVGLSEDSPPWLHRVICSDVEFESTMRRLTNYCFLEVQTSAESWSMHTCVHDWTLSALNLVMDEKQYWYSFDCVDALIAQEDFNSLGYFRLTDLTAHALRLGDVGHHRGGIMETLHYDRLGKAFLIAELLTQQDQYVAAEQMYMLALAGYGRALGAEHMSTLDTVNNLGILYARQDKLEEAEKIQ
ncbi:hypothetical protein DV737_g3329, partial [Chaetothyriales sp. CBS 132003]